MTLRLLSLYNFRPFKSLRLEFDSRWNWIVGPNASGKTSLLEAIFLLSRGHSFRASKPQEMVHWGERELAVAGETEISLGIAFRGKERLIKVGGKRVKSRAELARHLAVQLIAPPLYELLEGSPALRRRFLDWGLFYSEPEYLTLWQSYRRALQQRNAALKRRDLSLAFWSGQLVKAGIILKKYRQNHLKIFTAELAREIERLELGKELQCNYLQGWPQQLSLEEALQRDRKRDLERGYTHSGPHRDDFVLLLDGRPVAKQLSRGQTKLWTTAMAVVQAKLLKRPVVLLIDDITAELDRNFQERFWHMVRRFPGQCLITSLDETLPGRFGGKQFQLQAGSIKER